MVTTPTLLAKESLPEIQLSNTQPGADSSANKPGNDKSSTQATPQGAAGQINGPAMPVSMRNEKKSQMLDAMDAKIAMLLPRQPPHQPNHLARVQRVADIVRSLAGKPQALNEFREFARQTSAKFGFPEINWGMKVADPKTGERVSLTWDAPKNVDSVEVSKELQGDMGPSKRVADSAPTTSDSAPETAPQSTDETAQQPQQPDPPKQDGAQAAGNQASTTDRPSTQSVAPVSQAQFEEDVKSDPTFGNSKGAENAPNLLAHWKPILEFVGRQPGVKKADLGPDGFSPTAAMLKVILPNVPQILVAMSKPQPT